MDRRKFITKYRWFMQNNSYFELNACCGFSRISKKD